MTRLVDIAHGRAGDKGDTSILMVAPYAPGDYARVEQACSTAAVAAHFAVPVDSVTVIANPVLLALTIVIRGLLDGGVTRSGRIDPHGKTIAAHLLELECD